VSTERCVKEDDGFGTYCKAFGPEYYGQNPIKILRAYILVSVIMDPVLAALTANKQNMLQLTRFCK
jgi:hypothetical protein